MKKYLKVLIVVLLVVATMVGTGFFFFSKLKDKNNSTVSFANMMKTETSIKFREDLTAMNSYINSDGTDTRMNLLISTNDYLDKFVYILSSYYVENNTQIKDAEVSKALKNVESQRAFLNSMIAEYKIKKDSPWFNRHTGANDFYLQMCSYLLKYASLTQTINTSLTMVDKNVDIKFNVIDIYTNVVLTTFSKVDTTTNLYTIKNEDDNNINLLNSTLVIEDMFVKTSVDQFSILIRQFNDYYHRCNKHSFAVNLYDNVKKAKSDNLLTLELATSYYFKEIFGINL